ncbi:MAG: 2-phospho-L-lactate guanylyltransferase [Chloroflexi bacterium]|nr:MAG: 2-phospho-L-lactate guanylyltransferase [Chloroflexota bacterium]
MTGARVVVLVKDFGSAKQRLSPALDPDRRRELAVELARKALAAAGPDAIVVAGSEEAAALARELAAEVIVEAHPTGQRDAARRGIERALELGAGSVLLLSSDLPLVSRSAVEELLRLAAAYAPPVAVAAPAIGRGGTNALFLNPPEAIGLHFGDDSLRKFEAEAHERGVRFEVFESDAFALDLDEPSDLVARG